MKSRRAFLVEPHKMEIREVDVTPGPGEVMVKIAVCGLCNWELNHWHGLLGTPPQPLGHEWAGEVVELGAGVNDVAPGEYITGFLVGQHGFSDYACAPQGSYFKLAPTVKPTDALGEPLACVTNVVRASEPQVGDFGVILGCGPMGLWCTQILQGSPLAALIAIDTQDWRLDLARKYGATHTINPQTEDAVARLTEITGGHLADFVIEGTGVPAVLQQACRYLRTGQGRLSVMSSHEQVGPAFDWRDLIAKGIQIRGTHPAWALSMPEELRRAVLLLNQGVFHMEDILTHRFPLDSIQEAMETLEHKPQGYLKGVVLP